MHPSIHPSILLVCLVVVYFIVHIFCVATIHPNPPPAPFHFVFSFNPQNSAVYSFYSSKIIPTKMPFHLSNIETSEQYIEGEHVVYCPINKSPRSSVGLIERVLTGETHAKSASPKMDKMDIHAKPEEPRYVIRNLNTGKSTAYKRYNIMRRASKEEIDSKHSNFSLDRDTSPHAEAPHHGVPIK